MPQFLIEEWKPHPFTFWVPSANNTSLEFEWLRSNNSATILKLESGTKLKSLNDKHPVEQEKTNLNHKYFLS